tara:strand:- start:116 stop:1405 length:1290 start_codon:yes stop_codon:yes gene_type:complete
LIPSSNSRSSHATNAGRFEPYLLSIGQAISISEIFLEKLSQTFGGEASRRSAILGIESTKAILRLMVLLERQEATMLLRWGVGNNGKVLKLKDYYLWYRRQYDSHSMRSPAFLGAPFIPSTIHEQRLHSFMRNGNDESCDESAWSDEDETERNNNMSFVGKRSGIVLKIQSPVSVRSPNLSTTSSSEDDNSGISTGHVNVSSMERDVFTDGDKERILPGSNDDETMEEDLDMEISPSSSSAFTPEMLLIVGEVLYILRPAIYAAAMKYFDENMTGEGVTDAQDEDGVPRDGESFAGFSGISSIKDLYRKIRVYMAWLISLVIDLVSISLTNLALQIMKRRALEGLENHERMHLHEFDKELSRRRTLLLLYLMRSPLFNRATLPAVKFATYYIRKIPIIGSFIDYGISATTYVNRTHFQASGSSATSRSL